MMGFSSFDYRGGGGGGGSSSTSNLSPLAPPFTIDQTVPKSKPKPNPNLSGHFTEDPYAFSYTSSHGNWVNQRTPTSLFDDSFTNPNSKNDYNCGTSLPSATSSYSQSNPYYFGAQSANTLGTHTSTTTTTTLSDSTAFRTPFSYEPLFDTVVGDTLNQVDPCYHPRYPPAVIHDKHPPSLVINRPGSDVQPMPLGVTPLEMSSQTDYTENLFGLDYNAPWGGGLWNGNNDWDQGNRKDSYGSFGWKEKNMAGSSTWKSPLKQGEKSPDDLLGYSVESLSGSSHIAPRGADLLNAKCSSTLEENARVTPFNMRPSIFGSSSVFSEVAYPQEQSPGPVMPSWSEFNPNNNSYDRCFSELDSCTTNPTVFYPPPAYSSPALKIRSPTNEAFRSAFNKHVTPANVKVIDRPGSICDNRQNASYMSSNSSTRDPLIHLGVEHKEGFGNTNTNINELDRNDHIFVNSSPMIKDMSSSCSLITDNSLKHSLKARSDPQVNECNLSDAFTSTSLANQEGDVVESSLESFDQVNTAVDSPCWKGAPASRQSPFAVTEFVNPQVVIQELSGFKVFSINDVASVANSSPKLHVDIVQNENGGVEYGDFTSNPKLKPSHMMHSSLKNDDGASAGQLATDCRVADPGIDVNSAPQDGSSFMSSTTNEQAPISPSSGVTAPTKLTKPVDEACDTMANLLPKLDARLLVNAMHNLSELLLSACSNEIDALKEHDNEVLQNVIDNLDTLKKVGLRRSMPESQDSQFPPSSSTSYCLRKLTDLRKGIATDKSQVRSVVANDIQSQIDATLFGKKQEVFSDIVSQSDTDSEKDNGITQALEKALKEDFHDDEDSLPQILLYKNLWLEAEAALCSMKYKVGFARMKIEMEKSKLQQEKDVAENPINVEKIPKASRELEPMIKEGSVTNNSTEETSQSSTTPIEDVDSSVMARFRILRCRVENSSDTNREGELLSRSIDVETTTQLKESIDNLELEETVKTWPYIGDRIEDREILADGSPPPDAMLHGIHQTESERGLNRDVSRRGQEFQAYVSEMPMTNHSYMVPNCFGKQLPNGGYDMNSLSSSDWEHVLKDEFFSKS